MKKKGSWRRAVIGILAICLVLPATLFAQGTPSKTFKPEELDQLLAPVALYPDELLTQIFDLPFDGLEVPCTPLDYGVRVISGEGRAQKPQ